MVSCFEFDTDASGEISHTEFVRYALRDGLRGLINAYDTNGAGQVDTTSFVQQLVTTRGYNSRKKKLQVWRARPAAHPHIATE